VYGQPQDQLLGQVQLGLQGRVIQQIDLFLGQVSARGGATVHVKVLDPFAGIVFKRVGEVPERVRPPFQRMQVEPGITAEERGGHRGRQERLGSSL